MTANYWQPATEADMQNMIPLSPTGRTEVRFVPVETSADHYTLIVPLLALLVLMCVLLYRLQRRVKALEYQFQSDRQIIADYMSANRVWRATIDRRVGALRIDLINLRTPPGYGMKSYPIE